MSDAQPSRVIPFKGLRGIIARRMTESVNQKPHVTLMTSAQVDRLEDALRCRAGAGEQEMGARLSMTGLLVKLTYSALAAYPRINGRVEGDEIRLYPFVNMGIAVALEDGLIVPVIKNVASKSLTVVATELADLALRARAGKLKPPELMDGTFTISNLGTYGVDHFTPIINPPEIAILGVGRVQTESRWQDGRPVPVRVMQLSLSFDHAAIDGAQAATFLQHVVQRLEEPEEFLGP
jgi:pyruvate dehydrogenase E2 component (dihydrolipoamide acetyltransferase)